MERKRKMSIMVRLLLMVISPCLLLGIAMTLYFRVEHAQGNAKDYVGRNACNGLCSLRDV